MKATIVNRSVNLATVFVLALLMTFCVGMAQAAVVFQDDFEDDTVGQFPVVTSPPNIGDDWSVEDTNNYAPRVFDRAPWGGTKVLRFRQRGRAMATLLNSGAATTDCQDVTVDFIQRAGTDGGKGSGLYFGGFDTDHVFWADDVPSTDRASFLLKIGDFTWAGGTNPCIADVYYWDSTVVDWADTGSNVEANVSNAFEVIADFQAKTYDVFLTVFRDDGTGEPRTHILDDAGFVDNTLTKMQNVQFRYLPGGALMDEYVEDLVISAGGGGTEPIPGDANRDDVVNDADASILAAHWQQTGMGWGDGDFNGDTNVNDQDASILAAHWLESQEGTSPVPEPSTVVLLAFAAVSLLVWRRRK